MIIRLFLRIIEIYSVSFPVISTTLKFETSVYRIECYVFLALVVGSVMDHIRSSTSSTSKIDHRGSEELQISRMVARNQALRLHLIVHKFHALYGHSGEVVNAIAQ